MTFSHSQLVMFGVRFLMALIAVANFMAWVWVYRSVGGPALSVEYAKGLALHPGCYIGFGLSIGFMLSRQYLFAVIGTSQTYWTGAVTAVFQAGLMIALLQTQFSWVQWAGAALVLAGAILVTQNGGT